MTGNYMITIGRQPGSGGLQVAERLSKLLNIPYYDRELIRMAARESGLDKTCFEKIDEKASHTIFGGLFNIKGSMIEDYYSGHYLSNETLFTIQSEVIRRLANEQSAIFVGRCADYVLKDYPQVLNIFLSARLEDRVHRIAERHQLSPDQATDQIRKTDKKRAAYYNYLSNKTWGRADSYDLCLNTSVLGIDQTIEFLRLFIIKRFGLGN